MVIKVWKMQSKRIPTHLCKQILSTCASSLLSLSGGLNFGITAVMLPKLKQDPTFSYDHSYDSWIASVASLSMIIGCLGIGTFIDRFGRKAGHIILNVPYIIGWLCIYFASDVNHIITGRLITGLASGAIQSISLVYIGEISTPSYRSFALLIPTLMTHIGLLISHVAGGLSDWRKSILVCLFPSLILFFMSFFLKESPLWLLSKGKLEKGIHIFRWFRGEDDNSEKELKCIIDRQNDTNSKTDVEEILNILISKSFLKPFIVLVALMCCVQCVGNNFIAFYALEVFEYTFSGKIDAFQTLIICDCIRSVVSISLCMLSKKIPKRKTLLISCLGIVVSLSIFVISLNYLTGKMVWVSLTFLLLYMAFGSAVSTISWTFVPELMPNKVRGVGSGIISSVFFLTLFTGVKIMPNVWLTYGLVKMYSSFCGLTCFWTIVLYCIVPDTTGKTLQDIEDDFNQQKTNVEP